MHFYTLGHPEKMASTLEYPTSDLQNAYEHPISTKSPIQEYFSESTVFITGATGFIGKLIVEKLLRTCTDIKKIYVLIRSKKGKTIEQRYDEFLDCIIFERLKKEHPKFAQKLTLISGDCQLPDLGLRLEDKETLIEEVNCVFHCAATVRFDEKIQVAAHINVRGTRDMLRIAKKMKNLTSFVHVSTAYSHCVRSEIDEILYEPTISGEKLLTLVDTLDDELLQKVTPALIGKWPNTYVFTKAVAEDVVKTEGKGLPIAVTRPSVVIATVRDPVPGWIDNLYGATGIFLGGAIGLIRSLNCNPDVVSDMVPADYFINCTIAAAWNVALKKESPERPMLANGHTNENKNNKEEEKEKEDVPVYNYVSSPQKPITWRQLMPLMEKHLIQIPTPLLIWYPFMFLNPNRYMHLFCVILMHRLPAYIVDFVLYCIGKQPMLVKGYQKIDKFLNVLTYFSTRQWTFKNKNTQSLFTKLELQDQKLFNFDLSKFDWDAYIYNYVRGGRMYLLKDPLDTIPEGRKKYLKLKVAHYILLTILVYGLVKLLLFLYGLVF